MNDLNSTAREICQLQNLGEKSSVCLQQVGIMNAQQLIQTGAINAYLKLLQKQKYSLNFLYAMVGAITNRNCLDIPKSEKYQLLNELEQANK